MTTVAVFGAGNIGRGLIGWLFGKSGWEVVFVDISPELVEALNQAGSYPVTEVGRETTTVIIPDVRAVNPIVDSDQAVQAVSSADLICTAVGTEGLEKVAPVIAAALARPDSRVRNVLACENADPNTARLQAHVSKQLGYLPEEVGFPETLVDRLIPGPAVGAGLAVQVESRFDFKIAAEDWSGYPPQVEGFELVANLELHRRKKLWLVNGLHAGAAFLGLHAGHDTIAQAVSDPDIRPKLEEMVGTMAEVLAERLGEPDPSRLVEYGHFNLDRFGSSTLVDPVRRVARNPLRKLGPQERLLGPAREAARRGLPVEALCDAIVAGLTLQDDRVPGGDELKAALESRGWKSVVGLGIEDDRLLAALDTRMRKLP